MKLKKMTFFVVLLMMVMVPLKVSAIDTGDCIAKYGSISLKDTGGNNEDGGKIVKPEEDFSKWTTDARNFEINVQSDGSHKVTNVEYTIEAGTETCSGVISGSDLLKNTGNSEQRSDSSKKGKTPNLKVAVNYEEYADQRKEYSSTSFDDISADEFNICTGEIMETIDKYWSWVMFLAPLLLLVMMTIDFLKAMAANDADAIKKSTNNTIKRTIATLVLLALPWVLRTIFALFGIDEICF